MMKLPTALKRRICGALAGFVLGAPVIFPQAADQPQWGQAWTRNMVSSERGLPSDFDPVSGRNVRWSAPLGTESYGSPIIAKGRVYIGTNNGDPRDPRHQGDRGVLLCLDERDGSLLWQLVCPKREEDPYLDWPKSGLSSPPTIEGDRVFVVSNRGELLCLDVRGLSDGNQGEVRDEGLRCVPKGQPAMETGPLDADILWSLNLTEEAGIWSHDGAHSSILIRGDHLYLNTGTGVDNTHRKIRTPDAPSLIVVHKKTGRLLARDREGIAPRIFHCTWSSPALAKVAGRETLLFAGGDGVLYGFEPLSKTPAAGEVATLVKRWSYDPDPEAPKTEVHRYNSNRLEGPSNIYGMPVAVDGKVFLAGGGDLFWGKNSAWLQCIVPAGLGTLAKSAKLWEYPLTRHTMSTPAVHDGLLYVTDCGRIFHCVEAGTGAVLWTHEARGEFWSSPMVADGKVYAGSRRGDFLVFEAGRRKNILATVDLKSPISATATAANKTLFISTMNRIYAVGRP